MQPMQGDPDFVRAMEDQLRLPITDLWRVHFIFIGPYTGNQAGEMEWCVVRASDPDDAEGRALDAMITYHGWAEIDVMSTEPYDEPDPEGWPDELEQIVRGVWV